MEATETAAEEKRPTIISMASQASPINMLIGLGIVGVGGFFVYKHIHDAKLAADQAAANTEAGSDQPTNLANQIFAENRSTYTSDDKIVSLFNQISDYKATQAAYTKISLGLDLLADTEKHVHSATYQQLLNILGIASGAKKATSTVVADSLVKTTSKPGEKVTAKWLVTKADARIRKTPFAETKTHAYLHLGASNIIATVPTNTVVGFVDALALVKNGNKPFYDTKNDTYFLPVLMFDKKNAGKTYPVYVAASSVTSFDARPAGTATFKITQSDYDSAKAAVSGLAGNEKPTFNLL